MEGNDNVELRIVYDWANRAHMYSLTVSQLALSVVSVQEICRHRYNLGFEEVAEFDSELSPALNKVERLWKIGWDLE